MQSNRTNKPIIALDARCIGSKSTGDTTYWTGFVRGLSQIHTGFQYLLYSNAPRPEEIPENDSLRWIELKAPSNRIWSLVSFPRAARNAGASIVHTQYNMSPLVRDGITTVHDVSFFVGPDWFKARDRFLLQRFVPTSARRAKRVITVSNTSREDIEKYIPQARGKTRVTYLACSPMIHPIEKALARKSVQESFGIREPYIFTLGTRWPRKNMQLAVEAARLLPEDVSLPLVISGHAGWGDSETNERTISTGYVDDDQLSALYSAASLYLAPSRYEGFGLPVLEAFRCGCPVMTSSGGSLPEVAGDAAMVEPSWDASDWAASISRLLKDDGRMEAMVAAGRLREQEFSWSKMAQQTEAVYKEVLDLIE